MAKTIKFNLICDKTPIRTIEDLQNHFSIEDVLEHYRDGLLERWLKVRGYEKELKSVQTIKKESSIEIITELIKIFDIPYDREIIEKSIYMMEHREKRKVLNSTYEQNGFKAQSIIDDYHTGYFQLVNEILDNPMDAVRVKANIEEMATNYKWAFDFNHRELFWKLIKVDLIYPILCLLMNEKTRDYFLHKGMMERKRIEEVKQNSGGAVFSVGSFTYRTKIKTEYKYDIDQDSDKRQMYEQLCNLPRIPKFSESLGEKLKKYVGLTDGDWRNLEPKGKKIMIISMESGDYVRPAGMTGGDLSAEDVNDKFVIVDGIDYISNNRYHWLLYMEA